MPLRPAFLSRSDASVAAQSEFQKKYGQVIKEAHLEGIRPMPLGRLLAYLGYEMGTPIIGRTEAVNTPAMRRLVEPKKQAQPAQPKAAAEPAAPKTEEPKARAQGRAASQVSRLSGKSSPLNTRPLGISRFRGASRLTASQMTQRSSIARTRRWVGPMYRPRGRISRL